MEGTFADQVLNALEALNERVDALEAAFEDEGDFDEGRTASSGDIDSSSEFGETDEHRARLAAIQRRQKFSGDEENDNTGTGNTGNTQNIDMRTREGREAAADQYSSAELQDMIDSVGRNMDSSIDLRTKEGRALKAAGLIDDEGFVFAEQTDKVTTPTEEENDNRGNRAASASGRSRRGRPAVRQGQARSTRRPKASK